MATREEQAEANEAFLRDSADAAQAEVKHDQSLWSMVPAIVAHAVEHGVSREAIDRNASRVHHGKLSTDTETDEVRTLWVMDYGWRGRGEFTIAVDCGTGELVSSHGPAEAAAIVDVMETRPHWMTPAHAVDRLVEQIIPQIRRVQEQEHEPGGSDS